MNSRTLAKLYYGKFRRPFRRVISFGLGAERRIRLGPLRGMLYEHSPSHLLGIYELHIQEVLTQRLRAGETFFDVGAHHGYFCLLASKLVGTNGSVFAFEPLPQNAASIRSHLALNKISNVRLVECAISDRDGTATLCVDGSDATPSLSTHRMGRTITVDTMTLDTVAMNRVPSVVLIDVEGAECSVLRGARKLLGSDRPPVWIVEIHSPESGRDVAGVFKNHGYSLKELYPVIPRSRESRITHWIAEKP
jgi:FkbM family methyltransferase